MARITVEDCLDHVENRFELVLVGAKRARQLAVESREPMGAEENDKPTVIALREIEEGFVTPDILTEIEQDFEIVAAEDAMALDDLTAALAAELAGGIVAEAE